MAAHTPWDMGREVSSASGVQRTQEIPLPVEFNAPWESQAVVCSALSKDEQASQKLCIAIVQHPASPSFLHQYLETTVW